MEKLFENGYDRELAEMKDLNMLNRKHREYYDDLCERFKYGAHSPISPDSGTTISSTPRSRSRSSHFHRRKSRDGNGRRSRRKRKSRSRSSRYRDDDLEEEDTDDSETEREKLKFTFNNVKKPAVAPSSGNIYACSSI